MAQNCTLSLGLNLKDPHDEVPLEFANIYVDEAKIGGLTDSMGSLNFVKLCPGSYHIRIRHALCSEKFIFVTITKDTILNIDLEHHQQYLQTVTIEDQKSTQTSSSRNTLSSDQILKGSGKNLSSLLESISGVYSIKNGSTISKPVIQGLSGNRIVFYNNGAIQAGQQWGADHAPEIDALSNEQITVIKGVDLIPYGGNGLGGIVLLEPGNIPKDPHLHGLFQLGFESNGRQFSQFSKFERSNHHWSWRYTIGAKVGADRKSPSYFLSNTGNRELSSSAYFIHSHSIKRVDKLYLSYFYSELGILRGSQIGNLTDLQNAFVRDTPYFTNNSGSYSIQSPKQKVQHILAKYSIQKDIGNHFTEFNSSVQLNNRKEYDVRRAGRSDIPALELLLQSYQFGVKDKWSYGKSLLHSGFQTKVNYNYNVPGTGIFPLIPNYLSLNPALYSQNKTNFKKFTWDIGTRYDFIYYSVDYALKSKPNDLLNKKLVFNNFSFSSGINYPISGNQDLKLNAGWTQRAPEVNELFSNGLHQSVSGIEEGNIDLKPEKSLKTSATYNLRSSDHLSIELNTYYQRIEDYIFLNSTNEFRLTIRGAFPLFIYDQTNAQLFGIDFMSRAEWNHKLHFIARYSFIKSKDLISGKPLVFIPPTNLFHSISWSHKRLWKFENMNYSIDGIYVLKSPVQKEQDFVETPSAYFLLGAAVSFNYILHSRNINVSLRGDNLLNTVYRDYLNRLRYYSNAEGINLSIQLKMRI